MDESSVDEASVGRSSVGGSSGGGASGGLVIDSRFVKGHNRKHVLSAAAGASLVESRRTLPYPSDISECLHLSIEDSDAIQPVHLFDQGIDFEERVKIEDSPVGRLGILAATGAQVGSGE